ncbi:MAG: hypothetical protein WCI60_00635 [bacterium]|jgi:hypothetical protein
MKKQTKKLLITFLVILLMLCVAIFIYASRTNDTKKTGDPINKVNYGPPTETEKSAGDKQKDLNSSKESAIRSSQANGQYGKAQVVVVDANQYFENVEVRAYISNVYETGGTCSAQFTSDGSSITGNSSATKDATTTQCGSIVIPRTKFPSGGRWQLIVSYSSPTSMGVSSSQYFTLK